MFKNKFLSLILLFTFFTGSKSFALDPITSRQLWMWFKFSKELPKGFSVGFQYQCRFDHNMSTYSGQNFYAVLDYKINKYLSATGTYQFFNSPTGNNHTFFLGMNGRYRYKHFTFGGRVAYQHVNEYYARRYERGHEPINELRFRVSLKYAINKKCDIYAYTEPYVFINTKANSQGIYTDKIRNLIGVEYEVYKYNTISLFYFFQPEFASRRPQYQHVLGVEYDISLPKDINWKKFFHPSKGKRKDKDKDEKHREKNDSFSML